MANPPSANGTTQVTRVLYRKRRHAPSLIGAQTPAASGSYENQRDAKVATAMHTKPAIANQTGPIGNVAIRMGAPCLG